MKTYENRFRVSTHTIKMLTTRARHLQTSMTAAAERLVDAGCRHSIADDHTTMPTATDAKANLQRQQAEPDQACRRWKETDRHLPTEQRTKLTTRSHRPSVRPSVFRSVAEECKPRSYNIDPLANLEDTKCRTHAKARRRAQALRQRHADI